LRKGRLAHLGVRESHSALDGTEMNVHRDLCVVLIVDHDAHRPTDRPAAAKTT
jgi:hypothetical protein